MSHASRPLHVGRALAQVAASEPIECPNCGETECDCDDEEKELAAMGQCDGEVNKRTGKHEKCAWGCYTDWEGDPHLHRGTRSWKVASCATCGVEVIEPFPEWLRDKFARLAEDRH